MRSTSEAVHNNNTAGSTHFKLYTQRVICVCDIIIKMAA